MKKSLFPEHLSPTMVKGIKGFNLCSFLIGLEGWRRGLKLTYHNDLGEDVRFGPSKLNYIGRLSSLSNNKRTHYFFQSRGDSTTRKAVKITREKELTKKYLQKYNLPILNSLSFTKETTNEEILQEVYKIGYPIIIKPTNGSLSQGVILNIKNDNELNNALFRVRDKLGFKNIILEKYFEGDDIRMYVIDGKVVAGIKRIPAAITGDGASTIEQLIKMKNRSRRTNPYLHARPIKINNETKEVLAKQGYKIEDVLEDNKQILVKNKSTLTQGVDLQDLTDDLSENMKSVAIKAVKAIPGMKHASIDLLWDGQEAYILEINSSANISMHLFPTYGQPRNIAKELIDYYFPESKKNSDLNQNMSFNYRRIIDNLKLNYTDEITIRALKDKQIHSNLFIIKGEEFNEVLIKYITKKALSRRINGRLILKDNNTIHLVVAYYKRTDVKWLINLIENYQKGGTSITSVDKKSYNKHIDIGFENDV